MDCNSPKNILTFSKYVFSIILTVYACICINEVKYLLFGLVELFSIAFFSNIVSDKMLGRIVSNLFCLLYNVQMAVLAFGNSYVTLVMLTNIHAIEMLSGKAGIYILAALAVCFFSFLSTKKIVVRRTVNILLSCLIIIYIFFTLLIGSRYSPIYNCFDLLLQYHEVTVQAAKFNVSDDESKIYYSKFYNIGISDSYNKDGSLSYHPNIILIFVEGLSQNIIDDEREIMPNMKKYQQVSLNFDDYYNHTFATYRGLIGQLYSGHQKDDFDSNELISIQKILEEHGYHTVFLNSEPKNHGFTNYLCNFGFNDFLSDINFPHNGCGNTVADEDVYDILYEAAENYNSAETPFFLATYTVGTHATFDSSDQLFGDGTNRALNKFYNADYHFGEFMKKIECSSLADNTIVILTTDHATYHDDDFNSAFPDYKRESTMLDEIPFFIYYKDVKPYTINVQGRNSLCLAPTILDYLDISAPNFFLGTSLFKDDSESILETVFHSLGVMYSSDNAEIQLVRNENKNKITRTLTEYFAISNHELELVDNLLNEIYLTVEYYDNDNKAKLIVHNAEDLLNIWLPTWSEVNGQDDIVWYQAEKQEDGLWSCVVDTEPNKQYILHVYSGDKYPEVNHMQYAF